MDLSFLSKEDKLHFQTLFTISGCSNLLEERDGERLLEGLDKVSFVVSCSSIGYKDVAFAIKGRSEDDLSQCVQKAARSSNSPVCYLL